ncbi:HD-GYP domain-containing protein [Sphingomonas psychrolutea]|uniref:Cyclic di-GMP phosphodiesterase n=1 Tax=Sphingomonas psychrolutea TaxID=1259676 RepID=A0ABQ1GQ13_9SPHN|nr:HD-GYP domain-containing protein [Sphingomonas psychrolutea]GGA47751.1 cyclic di-GMP phosphodiesterase [Sphingomonas psychrolutea]
MLKRVPVREITLGMYVHAIDGPWLAQPFWRSRFLLTSLDQIAMLRRSNVKAVMIDLDRCVGSARPVHPGRVRRVQVQNDIVRREADLTAAKHVTDDARAFMKAVFDGASNGARLETGPLDGVVRSITDALERNRPMLLGMMRLKTRDSYTYFHSVAVGTLMINFARELGLAADDVRLMGLGGLFHDIGKIRIAKDVLNKPGRLTPAEWDEMRRHPEIGHALLQAGDVPSTALDVCLHHHEKVDGSGYPFGLVGDDISLAARMGAICDVYDALTSERAYKDASSPVAAVAAMASWSGHFDPALLFVFMKSICVFPVGMLIRLRSGHLAMMRDNGRRTSRARLTVFYDIADQRLLPPYEVYLSDIDTSATILDVPDPLHYGLANWAEVKEQLLEGHDPSIGSGARPKLG